MYIYIYIYLFIYINIYLYILRIGVYVCLFDYNLMTPTYSFTCNRMRSTE